MRDDRRLAVPPPERPAVEPEVADAASASGAVAGSCAAAAAKSPDRGRRIRASRRGRAGRRTVVEVADRVEVQQPGSAPRRASSPKSAHNVYVASGRREPGRRATRRRRPGGAAPPARSSSGSATASRCTWSELGSSTTIGRPVAPSSRSKSTPVVYVLPEPGLPAHERVPGEALGPQAGRRRRRCRIARGDRAHLDGGDTGVQRVDDRLDLVAGGRPQGALPERRSCGLHLELALVDAAEHGGGPGQTAGHRTYGCCGHTRSEGTVARVDLERHALPLHDAQLADLDDDVVVLVSALDDGEAADPEAEVERTAEPGDAPVGGVGEGDDGEASCEAPALIEQLLGVGHRRRS